MWIQGLDHKMNGAGQRVSGFKYYASGDCVEGMCGILSTTLFFPGQVSVNPSQSSIGEYQTVSATPRSMTHPLSTFYHQTQCGWKTRVHLS